MTKDLHPGLGSGALREALTQRITDYLTGGGVFNAEMALHDRVRDLLIDCRAALSLSSPIEPRSRSVQRREALQKGEPMPEFTPQASSEIREAHGPAEQCRQDEHAFNVCGGCGLREEYWERWPECRRAKS